MSDPNTLAEQLLLAVKTDRTKGELVAGLRGLQDLNSLKTDAQKKAFWINIYNAFFQILRKEQELQKPAIYRDQLFFIAGRKLSLDNVEHSILRRYRYKFSLGYLPNIFTPSWLKKWAPNQLDYRIHFALNCGAKSCPPIAFYQAAKVEQQLELATLSFLESESIIYPEKKEVHTSRLFQWFIGDFGGRRGVKKILQEKLQKDLEGYRLIYTDYSWEEELDNYA